MAESMSLALEEAERVVKKQKICAAQTSQALDTLLEGLLRVQQNTLQNPGSTQAEVASLSARLSKQDIPGQVAKVTKELHSSVAKLGKALEKAFIQDVSQAYRHTVFDQATLNKVIATHFLQEGMFEVGDCFLLEANIANGEEIKQPYKAMHAILQEIQAGNLQPALDWTEENRRHLAHSSSESRARAFEFKLHRLQFLDILKRDGQQAALKYSRANFARFQTSQLEGIQRLMGCLCYLKRPGLSPYDDLLSPSLWDDVARDFVRHCCGLLGQASESPLLVAISAGSVALPTLLKLSSLLKDSSHALVSGDQLPIEIELGNEFAFRSVFSCPVSREQSSHHNPPHQLPCGHVLCKQSIVKIAKGHTRNFKCPYCPQEAAPAHCRQLFFPPML